MTISPIADVLTTNPPNNHKPQQINRMKVLHIITDFDDGGAQAVLYRFITGDTNNVHQVISLVSVGSYGNRLVKLGVRVEALDMPNGKLTLDGLTKLHRLIKEMDPDVIQTWMYHSDLLGSAIARLAGKRIVVWGIHNTNLDPATTPLSTRLVVRGCAILSGNIPQKIISCSQEGIRVHVALGYRPAKMVVVANGYDITEFSPNLASRQELRSQWQIGDDVTLFGMAARWDPQKDHANLIAALADLKTRSILPWHCVLLGSDVNDQNQTLVGLLEQYGVRDQVSLLDIRNDIPAVMNALDLHILSSSYGEAFPNVVSEAMACGTPCVVTSVGDAGLIVGDTGWVVPPRNAEELAIAMLAAVKEKSEPHVWKDRQAICRDRIQANFNLQIMVDKYNAVWKDAILAGSK
jgi:glycosyltransferase involved in cell wall biosynthesis